jgi:hypothetical protein
LTSLVLLGIQVCLFRFLFCFLFLGTKSEKETFSSFFRFFYDDNNVSWA